MLKIIQKPTCDFIMQLSGRASLAKRRLAHSELHISRHGDETLKDGKAKVVAGLDRYTLSTSARARSMCLHLLGFFLNFKLVRDCDVSF